MHASDLASSASLVDRQTSALAAARLIAARSLPGLVVMDDSGAPVAVVSAVDVLGLLVPGYILDDMALAGVFDEQGSEDVWSHAADRTIGELLDDDDVHVYALLTVEANASLVEIAAQMAHSRAQIALVKSRGGGEPAFVTLPAVMDAILRFCGDVAGTDV
ncbi:hypothetical protein [Glaciihabitans sp. UYNi722]|uniref:hypothetical protein n=1 Tax=Glaciihabitans sp. UYNi722 TaxID=3156344 RepID=UPI0033936446